MLGKTVCKVLTGARHPLLVWNIRKTSVPFWFVWYSSILKVTHRLTTCFFLHPKASYNHSHKVDQPKTVWNNQERNENIDEEENIQSIADIVLQNMDTSSTTWENDGKMQGSWRSWGSWPLGFRRYAVEDPPWKILKEPDLRSFLKARERWGDNYQGPLGTSREGDDGSDLVKNGVPVPSWQFPAVQIFQGQKQKARQTKVMGVPQ